MRLFKLKQNAYSTEFSLQLGRIVGNHCTTIINSILLNNNCGVYFELRKISDDLSFRTWSYAIT